MASQREIGEHRLLNGDVLPRDEVLNLLPQLETLTGATLETYLARLLRANFPPDSPEGLQTFSQRLQLVEEATRFVRRLIIDLKDESQASALSMIDTFALRTPPIPLLPNLEDLHMVITEPHHLNAAAHLLQDRLKKLTIDYSQADYSRPNGWSFVFGLFFRALRSTWHAYRGHDATLELRGLPKLDPIPDLIGPMPGLTAFRGDHSTLTASFMASLATSDRLREYTLEGDGSISLQDLDACLHGCKFRALQKVVFSCELRVATTILNCIDSPLEEVTLRCHLHCVTIPLTRHEAVWLRSLRKCDIHITDQLQLSSTWREEPESLSWHAMFAPLLSCSRMSIFSFLYDSLRTFLFVDRDLSRIAQSWPEVRSIKFGWSKQRFHGARVGGLKDESALTIQPLPVLLSQCPNLTSLALSSFDSTGRIPSLGGLLPSRRPFTFNVSHAHAGNTREIALLLHGLRPYIEIAFSPEGRHVVVWQAVSDYISLLQCSAALRNDPALLQQVTSDDALSTIRELAQRGRR